MTNVTLSIDKKDLQLARIIALQQGTTLNAVIREHLKNYIGHNKQYQQVMERIIRHAGQSQFNSDGRKWTRDELHER